MRSTTIHSTTIHSITKLICAAALATTANIAAATEGWNYIDTSLETAYQLYNIIDWAQTKYISTHPQQYKEVNSAKYIGEHPSPATVDNAAIASAIIHYAISRYIDNTTVRRIFQSVTLLDKYDATTGNTAIGIQLQFQWH